MANLDNLRIDTPEENTTSIRSYWRMFGYFLLIIIFLGMGGTTWRVLTATENNESVDSNVSEQKSQDDINDTISNTAAAVSAPGNTFTAGGYVEIVPPGPIVVTTRVEGLVQTLEVVEGEEVQAGQVILTLDSTMHRQAQAEAKADVMLSEARLKKLRAGFREEEIADALARMRQADARAEYLRSEVERYAQLVEIGATPSQQLLAAHGELATAEADLDSAKALYGLRESGQRPEDIAVAEAELVQAETRLQRLQWQVEQCVIRAPVDGVVLERFVRIGDWVTPTQVGNDSNAILTLFDPGNLQVWVEINQRDADRVSAGGQVTLRADALRGEIFYGRVYRVMPMANLQRNTVEVKIKLTDAEGNPSVPSVLRPEMSVQVTFLPPEPTTSNQE